MKTLSIYCSLSAIAFASLFFASCKKNTDPLAGNVIEICEKNESELRLKNHKSGVDYRITCDLYIDTGKLIVEPGVTVSVDADRIIIVENDGAIQVQGSASEPVTFQATESGSASWGGIIIKNNNAANSLQYLTIDKAGVVNIDYHVTYDVPFSIEAGLAINGRCAVSNVSVKNSGNVGIFVGNSANLTQFENIAVNNSTGYPLLMPSKLVKSLQPGNTFSGNVPNKVFVWGAYIDEGDHTWKNQGIPYLLSEDLEIDAASLHITEGTIIEVETDKGILVNDDASLKITGTVSAPVIIRGKENFSGWWKGILYTSNNPLNVWENVELSNGGSTSMTNFGNGTKASLYLGGLFAAPTRWTGTNVHIHDGDGCGILREGAQVTYAGTNITFSNTGSEICDE